MNVLVLHGPNLNLLGERPGDPPGLVLSDVDRALRERASALGATLKMLQSNHEGALVDALHAERHWLDGVIINPAALGVTSYSLRDALAAVAKPAFEVHLHDLRRGEAWRRKSVLKEVCVGQIAGKGLQSYLVALERLAKAQRVRSLGPRRSVSTPPAARPPSAAALPEKTLGRRPAVAGGPAIGRMPQVGFLTRAVLRQKIAERLAGRMSPSDSATWARRQWQEVQRGAPAESGQRELLEELLQSLFLSVLPPHQLSDDQLIDLMTRLDG